MTRSFAGQRVLVVEDEILVSWAAQDMLADLGCVALGPAASVDQALEIIASQALDAALLDINLNGQLSYPVADTLARLGVPFVFVTGYDLARIPEAYRAAPALQKPLHRPELAATLAEMLPPASDAESATP